MHSAMVERFAIHGHQLLRRSGSQFLVQPGVQHGLNFLRSDDSQGAKERGFTGHDILPGAGIDRNAFTGILEAVGIKAVKLPARSPNLNANLERWHRSVKEECVSKMILFIPAPSLPTSENIVTQENRGPCSS
jgi:hypothetical protein